MTTNDTSDAATPFSIIVPVYNAPAVVDTLLGSLLKHSTDAMVAEILVGDDASDTATAALLDEHAARNPKLTVIHRSENIGFLSNVNDLFGRAKSGRVILLNSDTIVPPHWVERFAACLDNDPAIALAMPLSTNASHVTVRPARGQSWRDVDAVLSQIAPTYPDAPSAVGCALAIRKALIERGLLFDPCYGNGYWEDADLHFHVNSSGRRSVIVDNLLIHHENGSPSFSQESDPHAISRTNEITFRQKWWPQYTAGLRSFEARGPLGHLRHEDSHHSCRFELISDLDVLFVLPAFIPRIGGIHVVVRMVEQLIKQDIRAAVCVYGEVDWRHVRFRGVASPFVDPDDVAKSCASVRTVIATHFDSFDTARRLAQRLGSRLAYFVQGPEAAFGNGRSALQVASDYREADEVIVVSAALGRYVESISNVTPRRIRLGPSRHVFRPLDRIGRDPASIAVCLRPNSLKGTGKALTNACIAEQAGFRIHVFGAEIECDMLERAEYHGNLNHHDIAELMNRVGFYLDCSYIEGLGLLPLEAAFCGAVPIVGAPHGLQGLLADRENNFVLPTEHENAAFFEGLHRKAIGGEIEPMRDNARALSDKVSEELAVSDFMQALNLQPSNAFNPARCHVALAAAPVLSTDDPWARQTIAHATALLDSTSWRVTEPLRVAAAALRGRRYRSPRPPTSPAEALPLIAAITGSTSWGATWPLRACSRVLKRLVHVSQSVQQQ